jgi:hypothetical protein
LTSTGQSARTGTGLAIVSIVWLSSGFHAGGSASTLSLTTALTGSGGKSAAGTASLASATAITMVGTMARQGPGEDILVYTTVYMGYGFYARTGRCITLALSFIAAGASTATHTGVTTLSAPAPLSSVGSHAGRGTGVVSATAAMVTRGHQRVTVPSEDGVTVPAFAVTAPAEAGVTAPL